MRNYITRAIGTEDTIEVDLFSEERKKGDRWLICSDGLYSQITKSALEEAAQTEDLETAADRLLQAALEGGGKDNISLILMAEEKENETEADSDETKAGEAEA